MAMSTAFRCIIILSATTLTTEKGRTALHSLIFALLLTGPVANISGNLQLISQTMSCSADMARNQTAALKRQLQDPINTIKAKVSEAASTLSSIGDALTSAFMPIYNGLESLASGLGAVKGALNEASYACTSMFTSAYNDCKNGINSAYSDCKSTLDSIPVIGKRDVQQALDRRITQKKLFKALEHIRNKKFHQGQTIQWEKIEKRFQKDFGFQFPEQYEEKTDTIQTNQSLHRNKRALSDVCTVLNVGDVCNILSVTSNICSPVEAADKLVTEAANKTKEAYNYVKEWFSVKVYKSLGIEGIINASKTAAEISQQIKNQLTTDTSFVVGNLSIIGNILAILLLYLIIQTSLHLQNYVSKDDYDNIYITDQFRMYDEDCKNRGKRKALPLKKTEKKIYIDTSSFLLTVVEFKSSFVGLLTLFLHMLICIILVFFDYVFYYVVYLVETYGNIEIGITGSSSIVLQVVGTGEVAKLLQELMTGINLQNTYAADLNFTACLPNALLPNPSNLVLYGVLYLFVFGTIIIQAYGMRIRRRIAAYFYPKQEIERIIYLHKKILFKRQGRLRFQFQHMRTKKKERDASQSLAISRKIANRIPAMTSVLKVNQRECLSCGDKEQEGSTFSTCPNPDCYGDYCAECFLDMNEHCVLCNPPEKTENLLSKEDNSY